MIAAGGTGGHLIPALAVARELERRGHEVTVVSDRRGAFLARRIGAMPVRTVSAASPRGRPLPGRAAAGFAMLAGLGASLALVRRLRPRAAAGFGGFPTLPPIVAARLFGVPALIHEQNAVFGRANRFLAGRVNLVATSFPQSAPASARRTLDSGVPVREAILALDGKPYRAAAGGAPFHLLVVGGSQGASVFGTVVPEAARLLAGRHRGRLSVVQQSRPEDLDAVAGAWRTLGVEATVSPFIGTMERELERAHLVIARSGASTVAELAVAGRPSILVPYPHAADRHQEANARAVAGTGGGWLVDQADFEAGSLAALLGSLMASPDTLAGAALAVRRLARADAAPALADAIAGLAAGDGRACGMLKEREA